MGGGTRLGKLHAVIVRTRVLAGSVIIALGFFGSSAALAQNCGPLVQNGGTFSVFAQPGALTAPISTPLSAGIAVSAAVSASNTAFMGQSTAFVSAPGNPKPDSEGAGIWFRGVGGELTL